MELPKDKIELLGKPYFTPDFVKTFIAVIERRAPNPDKYFFQVIQKENRPTMEFGCIAGKILLDITASTENTTTIVEQVSSVTSIKWTEEQNSTQLHILALTRTGLSYTTVIEDSRKELREYAEYLQINLFGK